ncbi:MAG: hypothetical protein Q9167_007098 [Letrouitia subvulpina]
MSLAIIPEITAEALEAWVSLKRIGDYLQAPEIEAFTIPSKDISFESAAITWPSDDLSEDSNRFILRDLSFKFPEGELSVISGPTGSGKSLLLASILGEVERLSGTIKVPHSPSKRYDHKANKGNWIISSAIAYVAQIPWIENATIKDNILFGLPLDEARYRKVISFCALAKDLEMLPDGELTDIGANGINLSGGQRWRVTFARALYSRAGILVLDDIFSAVDAHVGRQLFEEALTGDLGAGRTRVLVTHHIGLCLPKAKYAVSLANGTVLHAGFVEDLRRDGVLDQIVRDEEEKKLQDEEELEEELARVRSEEDRNGLQKAFTNTTGRSFKIDSSGVETKNISQPRKFIEEERREKGHVKFSIWREYLNSSGGWPFWSFVVLFFISYEALVLGRSWSIALWTRSYATEESNPGLTTWKNYHRIQGYNVVHSDPSYYLILYLAISTMICITGTLRYLCVFIGSLRSSRILFEKLSYAVLRAPLRWLDTVPVGRILNRFTADFAVVDSRLGNDTAFMLYNFISLIGIIIAGLFVSPYMLLCALMLLFICLFVSMNYLRGAREVKRLESNAKSPIFEQFGSSLAGISTIRAFNKTDEYVENMCIRIDEHARAFWYMWLFNRWLGFRLNIIGAFFTILVAAVIASATAIDASLAGFALSFALQYSNAVQWTIRQYTNVELAMNATERIVEYSQIPIESESGDSVPAAWPTEGRLEVDGFVAGYADDLPPVLRGLSFVVAKNQRIGVVGRTGAGKSSLTLALFRFLKAREGCIIVDGIDISKIRLHDLRSRLAIIPQDPVLFSGTVRSNLDAFDERSDAELYDALERVHLIRGTGNASRDERTSSFGPDIFHDIPIPESNTNIFSSLSSHISEGGLNLSQGQRQLLCLARAIVSRPKIMVLDEATSAVDMATDILIQRSIREEFEDSTLIVIAHRLSTIVDFDSILVMSDGKAVEFDTPKNLMGKKGVFYDMVEQSGEKARLEDIISGVNSG